MVSPRPHEKLEVWKKAMNLCTEVYRVTDKYPSSERYGLCSQMRRAAVSVCSNIAEGAGRGSKNLYVQSLNVARGSLAELDTQLDISLRLKYLSPDDYNRLKSQSEEVGKMLTGLLRVLRGE